jgi:hypothetical protein
MHFLGEIRSEPDPPGISRELWIDLIRAHTNLECVPPIEGINPFTRATFVYRSPPDSARVIIAGEEMGTMIWAEDGSNRINVFGEPQPVIPLAREIAETLGGRFNESRNA